MKRLLLLLLLAIVATPTLIFSTPAYAAPAPVPAGCPGGSGTPASTGTVQCPGGGSVVNGTYDAGANTCGEVKTSINYSCDNGKGGVIYGFLRAIIKFASGLVGLVVIMMLIIGGIRYITSAGDSKMVASAKNQIVNAVTGLVLFGLMLAILNFLLPGGIIG